LCGAVEACLSHGLRRRALGLFKTSSTTALIQKIAKICPEADYVSRRLLELELAQESHAVSGKRSSSSSDSIIKPKLLSKGSGSSNSVTTINTVTNGAGAGPGGGGGASAPLGKYLWIRLALHEKRLAKIIEHLVSNANSYYDREALVADPDYGSILSSLLVGPCALEFTRAKTADHYWSDPCADELSELLEQFGLNLHRIEKDVQRCDRNYWYFANENLDKLRNVISTYVWEHLDVGYMQGMCDLVAPLLVIFDDESLSYSCFCKLMERMIENFPSGGAMDMHFANMRSLIQILDSEMYDLMDSNGDYTHFYFCYRWFLLDFKRELVYDDVFATWEVIWAAKHIASGHFVLFLALALLETYRDIILSNSMDFTDVIKFFNEMAERHNAQSVLQLARSLVLQLQMIIENK
ncbi:GD17491, partial [Drosophila simulans]